MKQEKTIANKSNTKKNNDLLFKETKILFEQENHLFQTIEKFNRPAFICCEQYIWNANNTAKKLLEYKSKKHSNLKDFLPENQPNGDVSIDKLKAHLKKSLTNGFCSFNFVMKTKTSKALSLKIIVTPFQIKTKWFFTIIIQKHKEAKSDSLIDYKFKTLFTKIEKVSVIGYDVNRKVTYWNNTSEKTYGYTKNEAIGKKIEQLIVPNDIKELFINSLTDFYNRNIAIASTELTLRDKNNSPVYAFSNHVVLQNPNGQKEMYCINFDISQRKREELQKNVLQTITQAVNSINDLEKLIALVKKELNSILDTSHFYISLYNPINETIHVPYLRTHKVKFEYMPIGISLSSYILKTKRPLLAKEDKLKHLLNTGKIKILEPGLKIWLGIPLLVKQKLIGVLALQSFKDENAYNQGDLEFLKNVSHEIGIAIERIKMDDKLKSALEKAQESDRLKSSFLANMSHEIRTPMNGILGFLELLNSSNIAKENIKRYTNIVNQSGKRLLHTINDIIDISRIESGQIPVVYKIININKTLKELHHFFKEEAKAKNVTLTLVLGSDQDSYSILTDQTKIDSILTNLIKNAIKFTQKGSIEFGYKITNHELIFFVSDTGDGIPENKLNGIFNRFEQVELKGNRTNQGSGLGLTIAKSYVEMLQGKIWVKSQIKKGSEFYFTIPLKPSQNLIDQSFNDEKYVQPSILIVGNDSNLTSILKEVLSGFACTLVYVKTGLEAIKQCKTDSSFDIILLETKLPDMTGYEATSSIREFNTSINIIAICSGKYLNEKNKALNLGCDACITKPINPNELLECITSFPRKYNNK